MDIRKAGLHNVYINVYKDTKTTTLIWTDQQLDNITDGKRGRMRERQLDNMTDGYKKTAG